MKNLLCTFDIKTYLFDKRYIAEVQVWLILVIFKKIPNFPTLIEYFIWYFNFNRF